MSDSNELSIARKWVEQAEEDFINAAHTLTLRDNCPFGTVCFHAQQLAEKYLKALLTLHGIPFPRTHNLLELIRRIPPEVAAGVDRVGAALLNRYAVETRYPGDWEPISRSEAEEALSIAETLRTEVRKHLPSDVFQAD